MSRGSSPRHAQTAGDLGFHCAIFNFSRKMPVFRDCRLRGIVIASTKGSLIYCNNSVDHPSGPVLGLVLSSLIILVTVVLFVGSK